MELLQVVRVSVQPIFCWMFKTERGRRTTEVPGSVQAFPNPFSMTAVISLLRNGYSSILPVICVLIPSTPVSSRFPVIPPPGSTPSTGAASCSAAPSSRSSFADLQDPRRGRANRRPLQVRGGASSSSSSPTRTSAANKTTSSTSATSRASARPPTTGSLPRATSPSTSTPRSCRCRCT